MRVGFTIAPRGLGMVMSILATLILLASVSPAQAAYPGKDGLIAFVGSVPGPPGLDIFTIAPDGSDLQRLGVGGPGLAYPAWSADGTHLVFMRAGAIVVRNVKTGQEQVLLQSDTQRRPATSPYFSPNGNRVVYSQATTDGRSSIQAVSTSGGQPRVVYKTKAGASETVADPEYSPDGKRIVFVGIPRGETRGGLWTMRQDGSELRRLTRPPDDARDYEPTFSPDGRHVLFGRTRGKGIMRVRADGRRERKLGFSIGQPTYSPSGRKVVGVWGGSLGAGQFAPHCSDLLVAGESGTLTHFCANPEGGHASSPSWQPLP